LKPNTTNGETHREDNIPSHEGQAVGGIPEIDTPITIEETDSRPLERTILQSGGAQKKMKVHKNVPQYTITKYYVDLVAKRVQDQAIEAYEDEEKQREKIMQELTEVKKVLEKIEFTNVKHKGQTY
jgi:hypothetical protein